MKRIFSNCRGSLGSLLKIASNPSRSSSAFAMLVGCVYSDPKKAGTNSVQNCVVPTEDVMGPACGGAAGTTAVDIVFSLLILVALSWLFLLVAIAIKVDDPEGSVFFGQERVGRDGRRFRMWKFRSMCADAEAKPAELQSKNEKDGPVFKMADDPRITRVGRVIRKTSIDELPQFLNVLFGQIPLRILKTRPEFSEESMGAFALPAKSSTNKKEAFSQVASCFASGLRTRCISNCTCNRIGGSETQFLAKPVFMEVRA